jgi:N-methylhydantoinase A
MAETVRLVTIRRGLDIRDFTLVAYGGAGPLHAADIAAEVGISSIVVPDYPAVFSALGAVLCDVRHDLVQTMLHELATLTPARLEAVFDTLTQRARTLLASESVTGEPQLIRRLDLRYEGQLHHLDVRVDTGATPAAIAAQFHSAYQQQYGYTLPDSAVELVNARLEVLVPRWPSGTVPAGTPVTQDGEDVRTVVDPHGTTTRVPVLTRGQLFAAGRITGPAFVVDPGTVTPVRATQWARPLRDGAFVVEGIRHA